MPYVSLGTERMMTITMMLCYKDPCPIDCCLVSSTTLGSAEQFHQLEDIIFMVKSQISCEQKNTAYSEISLSVFRSLCFLDKLLSFAQLWQKSKCYFLCCFSD